jgi:Skp family chaperone for outer membrane proteins
MVKSLVLTVAAVALAVGVANVSPASAQQQQQQPASDVPVELKIAIVDVAEVTRRTAMTRDIARQIDARRKELKTEIQAGEEELRNADQELQRQRVLLSPAAFEDERKKFESKVREMQTKVQQSNQILGEMRQRGERDFQITLGKTLIAIANANSYTLILRKREIMIAAEAFDITDEVVAQIDKVVPSYKIPDAPPAAGK